MTTMEMALAKVGLDGFGKLSQEEKGRRLVKLGLRQIFPIKQTRLHLGARRTEGGLVVLEEVLVVRGRES